MDAPLARAHALAAMATDRPTTVQSHEKTEGELRHDLEALDFSGVSPGDQIVLWHAFVMTGTGSATLPLFTCTVQPPRTDAGRRTSTDIAAQIVDQLIDPLDREVPDHVTAFYVLLAEFDEWYEEQYRAALIDAFETGAGEPPLRLFRMGRSTPHVHSIEPLSIDGVVQAGQFRLVWSN